MKYSKVTYKYKLQEDEVFFVDIKDFDIKTDYFELNINGVLVVKRNYCFDGASGPTIDTKNSMRASLLHDVLYQMMRERLLPQSYRAYADKMLTKICIEDGMNKLRATTWGFAVKTFAASCAKPKTIEIFTAP